MTRWNLTIDGKTVVTMRKTAHLYIPVRLSDWLMATAGLSRRKANKLLSDSYLHFGADLGWQNGENFLAWDGDSVGPYHPDPYDQYDGAGQMARDEANGIVVYRGEDGNPATDFGIRWEVS